MVPMRLKNRKTLGLIAAVSACAAVHAAPLQFRPYFDAPAASFPAPDPDTVAWLSARVPWLKGASLQAVPIEAADAFLARAAAAGATNLDLFTDPALSAAGSAFYLSPEVLDHLDRKFTAGLLPVSGTTTNARPFRMKAVVAGEGRIAFLFDLDEEFRFKEGKHEVKISNSGRVFARVEGAGDVSFEGYNGCGCKLFFCGCAEIRRMTKAESGKMSVETSRGKQTEDLSPIRAKGL